MIAVSAFASITLPETWTCRLRIVLPSAGALICTAGGVLSMFKVIDRVAWLPATSTAAPLITCPAPSVVTVTGAGQRATPLVASVHVKVTVAFPLFHPAPFAAGLTATSTTGGVLSILSVTEAVDWLPATSTAVPLTTCPAPSAVTVTASGQRAILLVASPHVTLTRTSVLFQPAAFAGGLKTALAAGLVLSILRVTETLDWFPAMSTAVPLTTCPAPSVLNVTGSGQRAIPLVASVHVKLTRASVLFQPAAFAGGLTTALTTGRLLSMLSVIDTLDWLPAMSTAVPLTTCPAPSVVTVTGSEQRAIALMASAHVKVTRTSVVFQPAAFAGGLAAAVMRGRSLSTPMIRSVSPQPGPPRSSTVNTFVVASETRRSITATLRSSSSRSFSPSRSLSVSSSLRLKSEGPTTSTPFKPTTALETLQNWPEGSPPLSIRRVYVVDRFRALKLRVTVTGAPVPRW